MVNNGKSFNIVENSSKILVNFTGEEQAIVPLKKGN